MLGRGPGPIGKIAAGAAFAILAACILSPPAYWATEALRHTWPTIPDFPFYRYFSRIAQISAIAAAVGLLFWLGIRKISDLGIEKNPRAPRDLIAGVLAALVPVILLAALYLSSDIFRPRKDLPLAALGRIAFSAAAVACVEEFLFRGVLLGLARKSLGRWGAILFVSAIFASVHFLRPSKASSEVVAWWSGFAQAAASLQGFPPPALFALGFLTLFAAGFLLAWSADRTRSLWLPIGIHAGWVLGQQGINWYAKFRPKPPEALLPWVGPSLVSGVVPTGILPLAALAVAAGATAAYLKFLRRAPVV